MPKKKPFEPSLQFDSYRRWLSLLLQADTSKAGSIPAGLDCNQFIQLCEHEGITPLLSHQISQQLSQPNTNIQIPDAWQNELSTLSKQYVATQLIKQREIHKLITAFNQNGLDYILLKGEALSISCYPQAYLRTRCDTDFIFKDKQEAENAWTLLQAQGYARLPTMEGEFVGYQFPCQKTLAMGVVNTLDIHHKITNAQWFTQQLEYPELKDNSVTIEYGNQHTLALSPLYALIHACIHRTTNVSNQMENRLIWLYDIHLLSQKLTATDWEKLLLIAKEKDFSQLLLQGLTITKKTFNSPIQEETLAALQQQAKNQSTPHTAGSRRLTSYYNNVMRLEGGKQRWQYIRETLFPPAAYVAEKYHVKNNALILWYYVKRIIDVVIKR
ncbi:MAG: nucleotidyltransferase family protein [Pseudomonadales bacterium]